MTQQEFKLLLRLTKNTKNSQNYYILRKAIIKIIEEWNQYQTLDNLYTIELFIKGNGQSTVNAWYYDYFNRKIKKITT